MLQHWKLQVGVIGLASLVAFATPQYQVTSFGEILPIGINDLGQVVGTLYNGTASRGVLWQQGRVIDLGDLGVGGWSETQVQGINNQRQAVGYSNTPGGEDHAFVWEVGVMRDIGTPAGGRWSAARRISDQGVLVGGSDGNAVMWNGNWAYVTKPENQVAEAWGVNIAGQVVGEFSNGTAGHAFLWQNGTLTDLGSLGGWSSARAINERGQIVGESNVLSGPTGPTHATLWQNGTMQDLGVLPGDTESAAFDINESGQIVGLGRDAWGRPHAVLWQDGTPLDVNALVASGSEWHLDQVWAINNQGQMIAWASHDGVTNGVLLTPIPEPCGLALMFLAVSIIVSGRRCTGPQ